MPARVDPPRKQSYRKLRSHGWSRAQSARRAGVSEGWAAKDDKRRQAERDRSDSTDKLGGINYERLTYEERLPQPRQRDELSIPATRALDDFGYFRRRYFGRVASPWQEDAAHQMLALLESQQKEFVVVNCPPGSGKSTLFTHDIPAWLTCRRREIRGLIGSRAATKAAAYTGRLRNTFQRTHRVTADEELIRKGRAYDAEAYLAEDFGIFRPTNPDIWRREEFTVAQYDSQTTDEKEPTWTSFGMESASLGWRVDFIVWDDVVDNSTIRTVDMQEKQQDWWESEAETRLEPDGVLVLQGQRLSAFDLYRHCLDMPAGMPDDDAEPDPDAPKKYHHIVYKAHYEDRCQGGAHRDLEPYPASCLLDPDRVSWRELKQVRARKEQKYRVVYQQEDVDPESVLVQKAWIEGGKDSSGFEAPGCWDHHRRLWEIPKGLAEPIVLIATADPSPTKFWAIELWAYHPATEQHFLLDLIRRSMDAPDFLDFDYNNGVFSGVMEEWQQASKAIGHPIRHWVVEINAAQRFLIQFDHVKQWCRKNSVIIVPHSTTRNKSDPEFGVQSIAPHFEHGRVRLPGSRADDARIASLKLVDEVTRWPDTSTEDCVMAAWFYFWNLPKIGKPRPIAAPLWRPTWLDRRPKPEKVGVR